MMAEREMNDGGDSAREVTSEVSHVPVMADEVVDFFAGGRKEGLLVDGTAGCGGHLSRLKEALPGMRFLAVDRDPSAVSVLRKRFGDCPNVAVRMGSYTGIPGMLREMGPERASGALFDLGLSSLQLDDPSRGFSYRHDSPLDMRFDDTAGETAEELLNRLTEKEIADIIYRFGQEGRSRRIAAAIFRARPLRSCRELADVVAGSLRGASNKVLSRVFQALRIAVNREMEQLDKLLSDLHGWTEPGARIAFITFHSLEDRRIKLLFRDDPSYRQHSPKWLVPTDGEIMANSRARPARLRMGVRS